MNKKFLLLLTIFIFSTAISVQAQERLTGLQRDVKIQKEALLLKDNGVKDEVSPISLPFYEDFSNYCGFPNPKYFADRQAYVNNTYPVIPPTIGAITLDALDENGEIYVHASSDNFSADTLTSQPFLLGSCSPADSLYFSFYYQPGGASTTYPYVQWERIGNQPERYDKLILEFGYLQDTAMVWSEVWSTEGESVDEWLEEDPNHLTYFKQVLIPIIDPNYLSNSFQFRFRNYASLEGNGVQGWDGNCDQWHIDYMRLNKNRTCEDKYPDDIAFVTPTTTFLHTYYTMPWSHFQSSYLKENFENKMANLSQVTKNSKYTYSVIKNDQNVIYNHPSSNENIAPYYDNGLQSAALQVEPSINFTIAPDGTESAHFTVIHVYEVDGNAGDIMKNNDTIVHYQSFENYFAYDDGTAEAGYSIYSTMQTPATYLAVRFVTSHPDTLRAVKIWFNAVKNDENFAPFTLMVWNDANGKPGQIIYEQQAQQPMHNQDYYDFITYFLDEPIAVGDTFYVGFYQNHNVQLNIGFDQNTDARGHFFYKVMTDWEEPFIKGSPMVRVVVGGYIEPVDIDDVTKDVFVSVYPNPTHSTLNVSVTSESYLSATYTLFDISGKKLLLGRTDQPHFSLNLSDYPKGVYLLKIADNRRQKTLKIVKY